MISPTAVVESRSDASPACPQPPAFRCGRFGGGILLSLIFLIGPAPARQDPAPDPNPTPTPPAKANPQPPSKSDPKAAPRPRRRSPRAMRRNVRPHAGPLPRWSCPEPIVSAGTVWRGNQIECAFTINNRGNANLNIKTSSG